MDDDDELNGPAAARFANLLKPIRDLTLSFDVDVSGALEEYLHETIAILEKDGDEPLDDTHIKEALEFNFAEAGLLIQGSAAVYGRKVSADVGFMDDDENPHGRTCARLGDPRHALCGTRLHARALALVLFLRPFRLRREPHMVEARASVVVGRSPEHSSATVMCGLSMCRRLQPWRAPPQPGSRGGSSLVRGVSSVRRRKRPRRDETRRSAASPRACSVAALRVRA